MLEDKIKVQIKISTKKETREGPTDFLDSVRSHQIPVTRCTYTFPLGTPLFLGVNKKYL